jgi:cation:H+ antiporter
MLATLAMFVTGLAAMAYGKRREQGRNLCITASVLRRDLGFFLVLYCIAVGASFAIHAAGSAAPLVRGGVGVLLLGGYLLYLVLTFRGGEASEHDLEGLTLRLWLVRRLLRPEEEEEHEAFLERRHAHAVATPHYREIATQLVLALAGIVGGAWIFVGAVGDISTAMGVSPLVLALIIAPVATELPEQFNSVIWVRQGKDTFALGNVTGAMVFQSSIPATVGIWFTAWNLEGPHGAKLPAALTSAVIALVAAIFVWLMAGQGRARERCASCARRERRCTSLPAWALAAGLGFWLLYMAGVLSGTAR